MTTKREGFFGTDNLHRAGWAALVGIAGFLGALVYQKINGPQKVVVESMSLPQTGQITAEISPRSKEISDLTNAIQRLAQATTAEPDKKRLRELTAEVDRLRGEVAQSKRSNVAPAKTDTQPPSTAAGTGSSLVERFRLPDSVRGYTSEKIFGVSSLSCPRSEVLRGTALNVRFILNDPTLIALASPLRVTVDKVRSRTDVLQVEELWAKLQAGENTVTLTPSLEPGNYRLTFGFYRKDQLSGEFPPLYSKECEFAVP